MNEWIAERSFAEMLLACLALCLTLTAIGLASGWAAERFWWPRGRKVYDVPLKRDQLRHEALGTALFHLVFVPPFALALWSGAIRFSEGWLAQALGFGVAWYGFVGAYYFVHRALHTRALFWVHRWHHDSMVTTPMTGLSMHPLEALTWVVMLLGPPIVLSRLGLLGLWGWGFFLAVHWIGNIAGHANAEMFPFPSTRLSTVLFSNPISYHSLHHARFDGHYGFAVAIMDRLFGTELPDWLAVHRRVFGGTPMRSLREKLAPPRAPEPAADPARAA